VGLDWKCVAVPLDAAPVRAIRTDARLWDIASEQPPFRRAWGDAPLPDISGELLAALPPGTGWVHHFDSRSYGQAEYLLDPGAYRSTRTWAQRERTTAFRIIRGDEPFAAHAVSGQGVSWRCSGRAFLADAVARVDGLDVEVARRGFSVAEMVDLGVYKAQPGEPDGDAFDRTLGELRAFAEYCRAVVARELDLVVSLW
jgi:hypothetical protein